MSETQTRSRSPFMRTLGTILKWLFRIIILLVFGALIGAGLYYGIPWIYREVIQPVRENTADIQTLRGDLDRLEAEHGEDIGEIETRADALERDLEALEGTAVVQSQALATAQAQLATLEPQMAVASETLEAHRQALDALDARIEDAVDRLADQDEALAQQREALRTLEAELADQIAALSTGVEDLQAKTDPLVERLAWVQIAQDLLRVRLLLLEDNAGAAVDQVNLAIGHLNGAVELMPELAPVATDLRDRMQTLITLIEERSFQVTPTLESLWADVISRAIPTAAPFDTPVPTRTPLPATVGTLTPTPAPATVGTPTPSPTITPTPAP